MLTVKAVDRTFCVVFVGQECEAVASDFSVLPFDDNILSFDFVITTFEELDDLIGGDLPWESSHLDSSDAVGVVELVTEGDVLESGPSRKEDMLGLKISDGLTYCGTPKVW